MLDIKLSPTFPLLWHLAGDGPISTSLAGRIWSSLHRHYQISIRLASYSRKYNQVPAADNLLKPMVERELKHDEFMLLSTLWISLVHECLLTSSWVVGIGIRVTTSDTLLVPVTYEDLPALRFVIKDTTLKQATKSLSVCHLTGPNSYKLRHHTGWQMPYIGTPDHTIGTVVVPAGHEHPMVVMNHAAPHDRSKSSKSWWLE